MRLLHTLFFFSAVYNFTLSARHIAGSCNDSADALSHNNAPLFLSLQPTAQVEPSPIPQELLGKHRTIKAYLSALRFGQIHLGLGDPFQQKPMPFLEYVLTGIKRSQAKSVTPPKPRLPVTPELLVLLREQWVSNPLSCDGHMLWAAVCIGFFRFLRAGEFTVPTPGAYDRQVHLKLDDLAMDSRTAPSMVRVHIKQIKTDPFRQGAEVYLGATGSLLCPVQALWKYLKMRGPASSSSKHQGYHSQDLSWLVAFKRHCRALA